MFYLFIYFLSDVSQFSSSLVLTLVTTVAGFVWSIWKLVVMVQSCLQVTSQVVWFKSQCPSPIHCKLPHKLSDPPNIHKRNLCTVDIPVIREHLFMDVHISAVMLKWTLLIAFTANKLPVYSAGLCSSSAFYFCWGRHCWHLQVWCLCYHGMKDLVRFETCGLCWFD